MAVDALTHPILCPQIINNLVFHQEGFQLPAPCHCQQMKEDANICLYFWKKMGCDNEDQNLQHLLQSSPNLDTVYPIMCILYMLIFPYTMICSTSLTLTTTSEHLSSCFFHVLISYLCAGETRSHLRDFAHGQKNTSMYTRHTKLLQFYKQTLHQNLLFNKLCL